MGAETAGDRPLANLAKRRLHEIWAGERRRAPSASAGQTLGQGGLVGEAGAVGVGLEKQHQQLGGRQ